MDSDQLEQYLQNAIFPDLDKGRPDWDKPHTQAVVHYLKQIFSNTPDLTVDQTVLLIAAYAHDWGYSEIYHNGQRLQPKDAHMQISAQKISSLLNDSFFAFLNSSQKQQIIDLVLYHDDYSHKTQPEEILLLEADTLGALSVKFVKPDFTPEKNAIWMTGALEKRYPLFLTPYSKSEFQVLFKQRKEYYSKI